MRKGLLPEAINFGGGQEIGIRSGTVSVPDAAALAIAMRSYYGTEDTAENYRKWRNRLLNYIKNTKDVIILAKKIVHHIYCRLHFLELKEKSLLIIFKKMALPFQHQVLVHLKVDKLDMSLKQLDYTEPYKQGVIRISFGENNIKSRYCYNLKKYFQSFIKLLERGKTNEME